MDLFQYRSDQYEVFYHKRRRILYLYFPRVRLFTTFDIQRHCTCSQQVVIHWWWLLLFHFWVFIKPTVCRFLDFFFNFFVTGWEFKFFLYQSRVSYLSILQQPLLRLVLFAIVSTCFFSWNYWLSSERIIGDSIFLCRYSKELWKKRSKNTKKNMESPIFEPW